MWCFSSDIRSKQYQRKTAYNFFYYYECKTEETEGIVHRTYPTKTKPPSNDQIYKLEQLLQQWNFNKTNPSKTTAYSAFIKLSNYPLRKKIRLKNSHNWLDGRKAAAEGWRSLHLPRPRRRWWERILKRCAAADTPAARATASFCFPPTLIINSCCGSGRPLAERNSK